jgi:hypothetical protein
MPPRRATPKKPSRAVAHPGVLAAHAGPVTPAECTHPATRRDPKNPGRCCACRAVGLDPPARTAARRR